MMLLIHQRENYTGVMQIKSFLVTALMHGGVMLQNRWMPTGLL